MLYLSLVKLACLSQMICFLQPKPDCAKNPLRPPRNVPRDDAMLLVPFKKAPPVDLVQPVTFYVEANYSPEDAETFKADIQSLQVEVNPLYHQTHQPIKPRVVPHRSIDNRYDWYERQLFIVAPWPYFNPSSYVSNRSAGTRRAPTAHPPPPPPLAQFRAMPPPHGHASSSSRCATMPWAPRPRRTRWRRRRCFATTRRYPVIAVATATPVHSWLDPILQ